ncbi:MAG: site-specific integrase [Clostridia bacterium]|nr:site-specific integrase [Clostridia bacterium]
MKKRKDGRYCKKVILPDGSAKYFYSSAKSEREANKDFNRQILQYENNQKQLYLFQTVADKWNTAYRERISDINYKKNTKAQYETIVEYFTDTYIESLTAVEVNVFINKLILKSYSRKTIANYKSILNMIFNFAILNGLIKYNPVRDIRLPNNLPKSPRKLPTTEELKTVASHYTGFDLLPYFILNTGCRKSEALAITRDSIDFENKRIKINYHVIHDGNRPVFESVLKTDAAHREIILLERLEKVIPKKFKGFLFSMNGDGKEPLTKCAFDKRWDSYCKTYGLDITAHQLRHGYATMLFEANVEEKDAQELMGHSDITLTRQIYTHIRNERKDETANKLNAFNF